MRTPHKTHRPYDRNPPIASQAPSPTENNSSTKSINAKLLKNKSIRQSSAIYILPSENGLEKMQTTNNYLLSA